MTGVRIYSEHRASYVVDPFAARRYRLAARVNWRLALLLVWMIMVAAVITIGPILIAVTGR